MGGAIEENPNAWAGSQEINNMTTKGGVEIKIENWGQPPKFEILRGEVQKLWEEQSKKTPMLGLDLKR